MATSGTHSTAAGIGTGNPLGRRSGEERLDGRIVGKESAETTLGTPLLFGAFFEKYNAKIAKNKRVEEKYECPVCFDTGYVESRDKDGHCVSSPCLVCDRSRKTRVKRLLEKANLPFHTMHVLPHTETGTFFQSFDAKKPMWMLFSGKAGSGKTTEAAWLANELITKKFVSARFYPSYDLVIDLNATRKRPIEHQQILDELIEVDLVILDDLFKSLPDRNSYRYKDYMEACYEAIWARYNVRKPLIVTTQYSPNDLMRIDDALAGRIRELSNGRTIQYGQEAKNWRARK